MIGLNCHPVFYLQGRNGGGALEKFRQDPPVIRIEVLNNNKCHTGLRRHSSEKCLQGFQAAG